MARCASTFCEGSYAVSNWNEGDGVHFLDSTGNGIYSIIDEKIENQKIILKIESLRQEFILEWKNNNLLSSIPLNKSREMYIFKRI